MRSPLEASLETNNEIKVRYPFTEYGISKGLKRVASARQKVLTTGIDTADVYSEFADKTIQGTETGITENFLSLYYQCLYFL